ncbi:MAG: Vitamin B12 dependent methionine synthase activation subunit [Clostridia bacterium]|nr:Vitamin B12 dependent methionine synthase activation subunit [Clostridia bacterium]
MAVKTFPAPPICQREILRYAGCREADAETLSLMENCLLEAENKLSYRVCYEVFPVEICGKCCDFGAFSVNSEQLAKLLSDCRQVIVFGATVGIGLDRLIQKYSRISPAKALMLQAIGTERIEALCDAFCEFLQKEKKLTLRPRFSPGYGDLPLEIQGDIFTQLNCEKQIGLFLNDSLLMSPTKSVTAFLGVE